MLVINNIKTKGGFQELKSIWNQYVKECNIFTPFMSYEWFLCCIQAYGEDKDLNVILVKDGDSLVGIAPLWLYNRVIRRISLRILGFITNPDTPYTDFIVKEERRTEFLDAVLDFMNSTLKDQWDTLYLNRWPSKSHNYELLSKILIERGGKIFTHRSSVSPYIPINEKWDTYLKTRSVKFRKTLRNTINRINKLNNIELLTINDNSEGKALATILEMSKRSWKYQAGIAMSHCKKTVNFFKLLNNYAGRRGWLFLWILKIDNAPVAIEYDILCDGKVYALRADFDQQYNNYSPGAYLEYRIIKYLFDNGYKEYNTGPGLNVYKLQWTDALRENISLYVCNTNMKGLLVWLLEKKLFPFLRWSKNIIGTTDRKR